CDALRRSHRRHTHRLYGVRALGSGTDRRSAGARAAPGTRRAPRAHQPADRHRRRGDDRHHAAPRHRRVGALRRAGTCPVAGGRSRVDPARRACGTAPASGRLRPLRDAARKAAPERDARAAAAVSASRVLGLLSIRNFVVVESLDLEVADGFSVLTGETGAGKSILLDALALLLGDRFELRQVKPGAERAELAAAFDVAEHSGVVGWLVEQGMTADAAPADATLPPRRTQEAQGEGRGGM